MNRAHSRPKGRLRAMLGAAVLAMSILAATAGSASAATTRLVDDDHAQCPTATFTTIQDAVNASGPGDTILVCNGVYPEQVTIGPGHDNLRLLSKVTLGATIRPPATPLADPQALVHIDGANRVQVRRFIITGPGTGTVDSLRFGVLVENNTFPDQIRDNRIQKIADNPPAANENGDGVRVGRDYAGTSGRAYVTLNRITDYQKSGVTVDGAGSFGNVDRNTIVGLGETNQVAQQGIQISRGAQATVGANNVSLNRYTGDPSNGSSFGILLFGADSTGVKVQSNNLFDNDYGLIVSDTSNSVVRTNKVRNNHSGGIAVFNSSGTTAGNLFDRNDARTNAGLDCEDDTVGGGTAGTANTWKNDRGVDASPPGICTP